MESQQWLADRFEEQRPRLRAVAYRMLGSLTFSVAAFEVRRGKIVEMDILADPERLFQLDLAVLED